MMSPDLFGAQELRNVSADGKMNMRGIRLAELKHRNSLALHETRNLL